MQLLEAALAIQYYIMENPGKPHARSASLDVSITTRELRLPELEEIASDSLCTEHEIRAVVRSLCQGTPDEQRRTIETYFTKDAAFVHPFCIVPSFERRIPLLGYVNSRGALLSIFQWYRMLSPTIVIDIDSARASSILVSTSAASLLLLLLTK